MLTWDQMGSDIQEPVNTEGLKGYGENLQSTLSESRSYLEGLNKKEKIIDLIF
jgi:hypothetical protein